MLSMVHIEVFRFSLLIIAIFAILNCKKCLSLLIDTMRNLSFLAVCQFFGSQRKTAEILGCTPGFVSHVINGLRPMPERWAPLIEKASGGHFKREELAPNSPWVKTPEVTPKSSRQESKSEGAERLPKRV